MADTEQLIDILIVVDAKSVMDNFQNNLSTNPNSPKFLGTTTNLIYMFVKKGDVVSGEATSDLNVSVGTNNIVRWRAASMTMNTRYSIVLYSCSITQGQNLISPPIPIAPSVSVPIPTLQGNTVTGTTQESLKDFYFQATGIGSGKVTYTFTFAITNNDGNVLGYFKWDPNLSVNG